MSDTASWFEGIATSVVVQPLGTLNNCHTQAEYHKGCVLSYALTDMAGGHAEVNDVGAEAAAPCGGSHGVCAYGGQ